MIDTILEEFWEFTGFERLVSESMIESENRFIHPKVYESMKKDAYSLFSKLSYELCFSARKREEIKIEYLEKVDKFWENYQFLVEGKVKGFLRKHVDYSLGEINPNEWRHMVNEMRHIVRNICEK